MAAPGTIDTVLRLVADKPDSVVAHLASAQDAKSLASQADSNGYTLLHAAASYGQLNLLRALIQQYSCNVNVTDEEGETPLFYAETLAVAQCLVHDFNADTTIKNEEGATAEENALANMDDDDGAEWGLVAEFLEKLRGGSNSANDVQAQETEASAATGDIGDASVDAGAAATSNQINAPPPLPPGVKINVGTVPEGENDGQGAPDPEFRRRIEELAARDDFQGEAGQAELRQLITEAVGGLNVSSTENKSRRTK